MKFGRKLSAGVAPRFRNFCLNYKDLKALIVDKKNSTLEEVVTAGGDSEEIAARRFRDLMDSEILKINKFVALEEEALRALFRKSRDLKKICNLGKAVVELESFVRLNLTGFKKLAKQFDKTWN